MKKEDREYIKSLAPMNCVESWETRISKTEIAWLFHSDAGNIVDSHAMTAVLEALKERGYVAQYVDAMWVGWDQKSNRNIIWVSR